MTPTKITDTTARADVVEVIPPSGKTSDLAIPVSNGVSLVVEDDWSTVDACDLSPDVRAASIPHLALNRKSDGGFVDEDTGEISNEIDFVWMAKTRTRAWWEGPYDPKNTTPPGCRSDDGLVPNPDISPNLQAESCTVCPHSLWGPNSEPPKCKESIDAMVFKDDGDGSGRLTRIRFGGLALEPARQYWASFDRRLPNRPPIAYVTRVALKPTPTDYGVFLVPRFERLTELTREAAQPIIDERQRRLGEWQEVVSAAPVDVPVEEARATEVAGEGKDRAWRDEDEEPF